MCWFESKHPVKNRQTLVFSSNTCRFELDVWKSQSVIFPRSKKTRCCVRQFYPYPDRCLDHWGSPSRTPWWCLSWWKCLLLAIAIAKSQKFSECGNAWAQLWQPYPRFWETRVRTALAYRPCYCWCCPRNCGSFFVHWEWQEGSWCRLYARDVSPVGTGREGKEVMDLRRPMQKKNVI